MHSSRARGRWCFVCHRAVVMKLGGEMKTRRLSVRDEYKFVNASARSPAREACVLPSMGKKAKCPMRSSPGILFWRRPTLARPIAVLPSGLQRFTSVFGMGTGGATTLLSPECGTALAPRCCRSGASAKPSLWRLRTIQSIALPKFRKNTIFNRHSQVANRKSFLIRWHLHTGFRKQIR